MKLISLLMATAVLLLLFSSCGSNGSGEEAISAETDAQAATVLPSDEPAAVETAETESQTEPDESNAEVDEVGEAGDVGDSEVDALAPTATADLGVLDPNNVEPGDRLLTPINGGGQHPLLEWEPIEGAASYGVTVYDADGWVYWGTLVDIPQTYVGGPIQLKDDRPGPRISEGMSWSLTAWDEDLHVLAVSGRRPIAP